MAGLDSPSAASRVVMRSASVSEPQPTEARAGRAPAQLADETPVRHPLPLQVQVRNETRRHHQINRPRTGDLIRHMGLTTACVTRLWASRHASSL